VKDVEGAAERPRENKFAIAANSAIDSDTIWALQDPIGDVLAIDWPEESETDAMERLVDAHMANDGGSVISGEDGATEGFGDDNKHEQFLIVLHTLEDDEAVVDYRYAILTDVVTVTGMNVGDRKGFKAFDG
jgi:hypothetical protein